MVKIKDLDYLNKSISFIDNEILFTGTLLELTNGDFDSCKFVITYNTDKTYLLKSTLETGCVLVPTLYPLEYSKGKELRLLAYKLQNIKRSLSNIRDIALYCEDDQNQIKDHLVFLHSFYSHKEQEMTKKIKEVLSND